MRAAPTARITFLPVLRRELRTFLRGNTAAAFVLIYLGLLLLALLWFYQSITARLDVGAPLVNAQLGQALFSGLALAVQTLTIFLAPATTLNSISSEYEQHALDMLLVSPLKPAHLLVGKLLAALAFIGLLLFSTVPLFSVVLLFGGVSLYDVARVLLTVLLTALLGCLLGLFCSALTRRTFTATILCYALLVALIGGTLFAANLWDVMSQQAVPPSYVMANPLSALAAALGRTQPPEWAVSRRLGPLAILGMLTSGTTFRVVGGEPLVLPLYRVTWLLYGGGSMLLLWGTWHAVQPRQPWRLRRADLVFALLLLGYALLVWLAQDWWQAGLRVPVT
jgi:ABC-type transport system involved in multi-copper enzyme maturation permease subunit